jgi:hypothetical protein
MTHRNLFHHQKTLILRPVAMFGNVLGNVLAIPWQSLAITLVFFFFGKIPPTERVRGGLL